MEIKSDNAIDFLAHRGAYRFVDGVSSYDKGNKIVCFKTLRGDEPFFLGHFPGRPITPGVFEIEMLFQAAQLLLALDGNMDKTIETRLASVDNARFMRPIVPPKELVITVEVASRRESVVCFSGFVEDGTERCIQILFSVMSSKI